MLWTLLYARMRVVTIVVVVVAAVMVVAASEADEGPILARKRCQLRRPDDMKMKNGFMPLHDGNSIGYSKTQQLSNSNKVTRACGGCNTCINNGINLAIVRSKIEDLIKNIFNSVCCCRGSEIVNGINENSKPQETTVNTESIQSPLFNTVLPAVVQPPITPSIIHPAITQVIPHYSTEPKSSPFPITPSLIQSSITSDATQFSIATDKNLPTIITRITQPSFTPVISEPSITKTVPQSPETTDKIIPQIIPEITLPPSSPFTYRDTSVQTNQEKPQHRTIPYLSRDLPKIITKQNLTDQSIEPLTPDKINEIGISVGTITSVISEKPLPTILNDEHLNIKPLHQTIVLPQTPASLHQTTTESPNTQPSQQSRIPPQISVGPYQSPPESPNMRLLNQHTVFTQTSVGTYQSTSESPDMHPLHQSSVFPHTPVSPYQSIPESSNINSVAFSQAHEGSYQSMHHLHQPISHYQSKPEYSNMSPLYQPVGFPQTHLDSYQSMDELSNMHHSHQYINPYESPNMSPLHQPVINPQTHIGSYQNIAESSNMHNLHQLVNPYQSPPESPNMSPLDQPEVFPQTYVGSYQSIAESSNMHNLHQLVDPYQSPPESPNMSPLDQPLVFPQTHEGYYQSIAKSSNMHHLHQPVGTYQDTPESPNMSPLHEPVVFPQTHIGSYHSMAKSSNMHFSSSNISPQAPVGIYQTTPGSTKLQYSHHSGILPLTSTDSYEITHEPANIKVLSQTPVGAYKNTSESKSTHALQLSHSNLGYNSNTSHSQNNSRPQSSTSSSLPTITCLSHLGSHKFPSTHKHVKLELGHTHNVSPIQPIYKASLEPKQFPSFAVILKTALHPSKGVQDKIICSGSLIHPSLVLTAANCLANINALQLKVHLGSWNSSDSSVVSEKQERSVASMLSHKQFDQTNMKHDVALLKLVQPALLTPSIVPCCLGNMFGPVKCHAVAFGATNTFQTLDVPVWSKDKCHRLLFRTRQGRSLGRSSFICAMGMNLNSSKVSGSPLFCHSRDGSSMWQAGVMTHSLPFDITGTGVYTDMEFEQEWIIKAAKHLLT